MQFHLSYEERKHRPRPSLAETEGREFVPLLGPAGRYLRLRLVFNSKGMMGLGETQGPKSLLVGLAGLLLLFFGGFYLVQTRNFLQARLLPPAWVLLLSGSFGNWIDRLFLKSLSDRSWVFGLSPRRGFVHGVTDFIDALWYGNRFSDWPFLKSLSFTRWPVFNLADMYLFLGILLFFVDFVFRLVAPYLVFFRTTRQATMQVPSEGKLEGKKGKKKKSNAQACRQ